MILSRSIRSIRGMNDYFFVDTLYLRKIECILNKILCLYNFSEIKLPLIEYYDLFKCAIGSITDIIEKEIYVFSDRSNNNIALRPEGTVGCVRAIIENGLFYSLPCRFWYNGPMFRYERPQKGRYRQFYQFGMEVIGISGPEAEVELILICNRLWKKLGLNNKLFLEINTIGSLISRRTYLGVLKDFLLNKKSFFDNFLWEKIIRNPLIVFDIKDLSIVELMKDAPILNDYIDDVSISHFKELCLILDSFCIKYTINYKLVRGLDYYNNTVFEWFTNDLGAQNTVCAGGRYDGLFKKLSKYDFPGIGCAIGLDRLLLLFKDMDIIFNKFKSKSIRIIGVNDIRVFCIHLAEKLRDLFFDLKLSIYIDNKITKISKYYTRAKKNNIDIILFIDKNYLKQNTFFMCDLKFDIKRMLSYDDFIQYLKNVFKYY
ncbi:histidine--tRNA ligase [Candidatus Purcelliella pentastirinorum]|uniref:histidine--tRNA ligase n=1 Tax=Candidatus Purcelliella pentastirinorum TaxID=472834 RepID=UPI0023677F6E|nr:histidine--tRNA ligase [Candidatus Purcelliella pentastirinorum]WDI78835.1 histidine--tRNA ligase [Candidatus Purcelliella pentastirinorum]WDR79968.1 histidine--tRNA ligase [Candidatus Purcelliella pentastirinorum]